MLFEFEELFDEELDELFEEEFEFEFELEFEFDEEFELELEDELELELDELLPATTMPPSLWLVVAAGGYSRSAGASGRPRASAAAPASAVTTAAKAVVSFQFDFIFRHSFFHGLPPVRKTEHGDEYSGRADARAQRAAARALVHQMS